jgi:hypothetical protein
MENAHKPSRFEPKSSRNHAKIDERAGSVGCQPVDLSSKRLHLSPLDRFSVKDASLEETGTSTPPGAASPHCFKGSREIARAAHAHGLQRDAEHLCRVLHRLQLLGSSGIASHSGFETPR